MCKFSGVRVGLGVVQDEFRVRLWAGYSWLRVGLAWENDTCLLAVLLASKTEQI